MSSKESCQQDLDRFYFTREVAVTVALRCSDGRNTGMAVELRRVSRCLNICVIVEPLADLHWSLQTSLSMDVMIQDPLTAQKTGLRVGRVDTVRL